MNNIGINNETIVIVDAKGEGHFVSWKKFCEMEMQRRRKILLKDELKKTSYELYSNWPDSSSGTIDIRTDCTADSIVNKPFTETYEIDYLQK